MFADNISRRKRLPNLVFCTEFLINKKLRYFVINSGVQEMVGYELILQNQEIFIYLLQFLKTKEYKIYFGLRFSLANAINDYLRLKILLTKS